VIKIAMCQIEASEDPTSNLHAVAEWLTVAANAGSQVAVFPEATMARFGVPLNQVAQSLDGPWARAVQALADENNMVVVAGMFTPSEHGRVHNTVLVTGRGHHFGYKKIHLYDAFDFRESETVCPGRQEAVFDVENVRLGVATCYDVRFPYLFQRLAAMEATTVLLPASWGAGEGKRDQWELLVRARALDSGSWIVACDQAAPTSIRRTAVPNVPGGIGYSLVADPFGNIRSQLGPDPGSLTVEIDPALAQSSRSATGALANRRLGTMEAMNCDTVPPASIAANSNASLHVHAARDG